jgi:hypothetical protein
MSDEAILKETLLSLGAEEADIEKIIHDVEKVITERILSDYFEKINPDTKALIATLPAPELVEYVSTHKASFLPVSEERCKMIAEETWKNYFTFMEQNAAATA